MPTYKERFNKKYNQPRDESNSISKIAKLSGIKKSILDKVFERGVGAWKTNPSSVRLKKDMSKNPNLSKYPRSARLGPEQWGYARVYSFVMGGKTQSTTDKDLWEKHIKK